MGEGKEGVGKEKKGWGRGRRRRGGGGEGGPPLRSPPSFCILLEGRPAHTALFSRSHCPTALRTALRYHHSNAELFSGAKIQLFWQDFIKNKQANHY